MKLQYTNSMWDRVAQYDIDEQVQPGYTNMSIPHIFRTQREADYFTAYALLKGVAVEAYVKWKMPPHMKEHSFLKLWAKLPELNQ